MPDPTPLSDVVFSVLDLAPVTSGTSVGQALRNSLDLAQRAERLGYHRYWVAEHHNMPGIASSAPAVLIGHLACVTDHMRIGAGGVMLPNHAPLVVAEQFGMLEALHPGRIDLGIGRAPGTDQVTALALRRSAQALSADDFPEQLGDLMSFFSGVFPPDSPMRSITAVPGLGHQPALWLLGSSGYSAQVAGMLGLPFSFAHHFAAENTEPALALYRKTFRPSAVLERPYAMIGVSVLCAETDERARWLAAPGGLAFLRLAQGRPGPFPTPEEAEVYPYTDHDRRIIESRAGNSVVGSPASVQRSLEELVARTRVDELMITTITPSHDDRVGSYERVAELAEVRASAS